MAQLANQKIAEVTAEETAPSDDQGDFQDSFPGYRWQLTVSEVTSDAFGQTGQGLKQIDVDIFSENQENHFQLRTYHLFQTQG